MSKVLKTILVATLLSAVLAGCGGGAPGYISDHFALEDVVYGDGGTESRIYRVSNQSVSQVADIIMQKETPVEMSTQDTERMFLLYDNYLIQLMKDANVPTDTLVEVSEKEFVRRHYDTSLLEAYIMMEVVDEVFDLFEHRGSYGGYIGRNGKYSKSRNAGGSIRYGSVGGPDLRGGGPGIGK